jgi:predicted permease
MLTESAIIAAAAGALGLLLSLWAAPLLLSCQPASLPLDLNVSVDLRVVAFTTLISVITGLAFGLAPALQYSKVGLAGRLKEGSLQTGAAKSRLRSALVIVQVTACVVLLVGASVCLRSLLNARSIDPGFETRDAVAAGINVSTFGYDEARGRAFYAHLLQDVRALPGVQHASLADHLPLGQVTRMDGIEIDGIEAPAGPSGRPQLSVDTAVVAPDYFAAMGIPILKGRGFSDDDNANVPAVVVINQEMADRFWPRQDPIGQFVQLAGPRDTRTRARIVGLVKTGKYQSLGEDAKPFFYRSLLQGYEPGVQLIVRTDGGVPILGSLRQELRTLDPRVALVGVETLEQHMQLPLFPARAAGLLLGMFGLLALLLAVVGLYGVISYAVAQRTQEIGVRMALGARRSDVVGLVLGQGLRLTAIGMAIGTLGALGVTRVLGSLLYGVSPTDPLSFVAVAVLLMLVAIAAAYLPARRATRVDPIRTLRAE